MNTESKGIVTEIQRRANIITFFVSFSLVTFIIPIALYLNDTNFELYYNLLQEDGILEWATFWAFIVAGILLLVALKEYFSDGLKGLWFPAGLALFCFLFALEEISWGQRIFGYLPPNYFLEQNFQQELNFHNILESNLRKFILLLIIAGYGVFIPLLRRFNNIDRWLRNVGVITPSAILMISFLATSLFYVVYPIKYSGEIVELMLGLCFMFFSISQLSSRGRSWKLYIFSVAVVGLLGLINSWVSSININDNPEIIAATEKEVEKLHEDFMSIASGDGGIIKSTCGFHKRVFTAAEAYDQSNSLQSGHFAMLVEQGLSEERANYFIDPWNSPYWVRDLCTEEGTRLLTVYSLGPDRKRQSVQMEIRGDDIGKMVHFRLK